jgi:DNA polymerase I-like protein with 3'-5' exonuclease and polymerase domains
VYCAKDACVTEHIYTPIMEIVKARKQDHLIPREQMLQRAGYAMQKMGLKVNLEAVEAMKAEYEVKLLESEAICKSIAGEKFNPRSFPQVGSVLFDKFGLAPVTYSEETGEPSTDDDSLRRMLIQYDLRDEQRAFIEGVRRVRASSKLLGTYLRPLIPWNKTYKTPGGEEKVGIVAPDGRIHPSYNRLPATGRYSSSDPNAQNIPEGLRGLFVPNEGHVFVACDSDQLEARYIGEEALAMRMVEVFNSGLDLHNETMEIIYGKGIWQLDGAPDDRRKKGKGTFKNTRAITKNVRYAWQYAAGVKRIWEQVTSAEDDEGRLLFAHLTQEDVREVVEGLNKADPEIPRWWAQTQLFHRKYGYIADRLWGRRRDFKGMPSINEQVNHPIQSGGFHMVAEAMITLLYGEQEWFATVPGGPRPDFDPALLSFNFANKTGLATQTHDSVMFEVPTERADEAMAAIQWAMTRRAKVGALLTYTAEAKIGATWRDV